MKMQVRFGKTEIGEVSAMLTFERGADDPAVISVDGMSRSFAPGGRIEVGRQFGRHAGHDASAWAENAIADVKRQIDAYRTTIPADYGLEY